MPRGKMSAEARAKIAAAQRKRWAKQRAANATGNAVTPIGRRPGRPAKQAPASLGNKYLDMTVMQLVEAKQQIDEAWRLVAQLVRT